MTHVQTFWKASTTFRNHTDVNSQDITALRQWCKKSTKIPSCYTDEQLVLFLHSCYCNIENAKKCIAEYYKLRRKVPQFFNDRDITRPEIQRALQVLNYAIIGPRNPNGYKIVYHGLNDVNPEKYSFNDGFKLLAMAMDAVYMRDGPHPGIILLFDLAGVKVGHVTRLSITSVKRCIDYIQDGNPIRLKAIHVMNVHPVIDKIMLLIRPFIRKQLLELLHFHKEGDENLYQVVPKNCLPSNYGGELESVDVLQAEFIKEMEALHHLFMEDDKLLVNSFRSMRDKTFEKDINLAKLDID